MKLVVIESPYAGDVERNLRYLRAAMADCVRRGESPYASHGLLTQPGVLRDDVPGERARGIRAGFAWAEKADLVVVYEDLGVTPGMLGGIERAEKRGQPIDHRRIPGWDQPFVTNPDPGCLKGSRGETDVDPLRIRAALDAALHATYRDSRNSHVWAGTSDCASHNEGLACCLDPNHDAYGAMLTELAARMVVLLASAALPVTRGIVPGALVELAAREKPRHAVMLTVSPQVGDRGRVVRLVHARVEGEPIEDGEPTLVQVLLEGQSNVIAFPLSCLRLVEPTDTSRDARALPAIDDDISDPGFDSDPDDGGD